MASIILSSIGGTVGSAIGGHVVSSIGSLIGSFAGRAIDQKLFSTSHSAHTYGRRMSDIMLQGSSYGEMINIIFGTAMVAGNIIWASKIKETPHTSIHRSGAKGAKFTQTHTNYSYSVSLAIGLCEGQISSINKIIADGKALDPTLYNIRIYKGTEDQKPDPLMEALEGIGKVPAYRGLAYIVFEDLQLAEFGNRIPNFNFEVKKEITSDPEFQRVEDMVEAVNIIPGCGEFVYDTIVQQKFEADYCSKSWIQRGPRKHINKNNVASKADSLLSLDQLKETLPNVGWVAPIVSWFSSSLNIGDATIEPGVEHNTKMMTTPSEWRVGEFRRDNARLITKKDGRVIYGGTPSDDSILRYLDELRSRDLKIMFYPMVFVDVIGKPWRGHMFGSVSSVREFFNKKGGYNDFIIHYANLVKGRVDAFLIGSEFRGLTSIKDDDNNFPAVDELVKLSSRVKSILGNDTKISYAADWSEYHHSERGWYNLDPLWASADIDFVGIDAYFPLTNQKDSEYDIEKLVRAWESGEGYDFYYTDRSRTKKAPLEPRWAWKNIQYWWENIHINPDGRQTSWVPKSKKIWFTEYGFPSVTCASNQPNVFYDPSTSESAFPMHSDGNVDILAQRAAIHATQKKWQNSEMVERKFLWTWDARPYPYWPNLRDIWMDGSCWDRGHWVQGKLGISSLGQVITELLKKTSLGWEDIDVSDLDKPIEGFCINSPTNVSKVLKMLQQCYFFDIVQKDKQLKFLSRGNNVVHRVNPNDLVHSEEYDSGVFSIKRVQEAELPQFISVNFYNRNTDFQVFTVNAQMHHTRSLEQLVVDLPIVMNEGRAQFIANTALYASWLERTQYNFSLPVSYAFLSPGDLVELDLYGIKHIIRITNSHFGKNRVLKLCGVAENTSIYSQKLEANKASVNFLGTGVAETAFELLDIPLINTESQLSSSRMLAAACPLGENWHGCAIHIGSSQGDLKEVAYINKPATMGAVVTKLGRSTPELVDYKNKVIVNLLHGELNSVNLRDILNYSNLALVGGEIIQFQKAELVANHQYELSVLLRGRFGTEAAITSHIEGERFVLLDSALEHIEIPKQYVGGNVYVKAVSFGALDRAKTQHHEFKAACLRPYAPCCVVIDENVLRWTRRTRGDGELHDNVDVALNEEKEEYVIEIKSDTGRRRIVSSVPYLELDEKELEALKEGKAIIKVSQLSQAIGEGMAVKVKW